MSVRALIVDDEPLAREKIRALVANHPAIEIIGEPRDGREAVTAIRRERPDLVFLDIQMPELDGFEVLQEVGSSGPVPAIVFVTAYDEYALKAFDVHAIDYLLKPFDRERFDVALKRAIDQVKGGSQAAGLDEKIAALLDQLESRRSDPHLERLVVRTGGRVYFVSVKDIDWLQAAGNYVELHVGERTHLIRSTMKSLEDELDPGAFVRVHRSAIVNISSIKELQTWFNGEYVIILKSGAQVTTGGSYRDGLKRLLQNPQ